MFELSKEKEKKALAIHQKATIVDAHSDRIMALMPEEPYIDLHSGVKVPRITFEKHINDLVEGGIKCQIFPVWVSPLFDPIALKRALLMIEKFSSETAKFRERIEPCTNFTEIEKATRSGKIAAVLSLEGGESLMGDLGILRIFHRLGVRLLGFTQLPRNQLADGSGEFRSRGGLTDFGAEVVKEMNRLNMIVDVSHLNEKGFWDALELSKTTTIASHSNCKALCDHHRNLTDDQIRALSEKKGVIGICFEVPFLRKESKGVSIKDVLDHIDHISRLVGPEHIGLGSDFMGLTNSNIEGLEDITELSNVTKGLVSRGYSEGDIENILGGNFLRVFKEVLK